MLDATPVRLLDAAIAVLEQDGEAAVRVRDVSAAAGVSYASLYHFYGDRDGLIEAAQAERYRRSLLLHVDQTRERFATVTSREELRAAVVAMLGVILSDDRREERRCRASVLGSAITRPGLADRLVAVQRTYNEVVFEVLVRAQRQGWVREDVDLRTLGSLLVSMFTGRLHAELDPDGGDTAAFDRLVETAVLALLFAEGSSAAG